MRRREDVPEEVQKEIAALYAKGRSYFAIMKKFKAHKVTTTEIVKARDKFGLPPGILRVPGAVTRWPRATGTGQTRLARPCGRWPSSSSRSGSRRWSSTSMRGRTRSSR